MKSFASIVASAIAIFILSACSPGQATGPLTIKGIHLGMSASELDQAAQANGWAITDQQRFMPGRVGGSIKKGEGYYGRVTLDDQRGLIFFELNTHAFDANDLAYRDFVESLQANYPIGELQLLRDYGNCAAWQGRGPAGEMVTTSSCGAWSVMVAMGAEQSGATFN